MVTMRARAFAPWILLLALAGVSGCAGTPQVAVPGVLGEPVDDAVAEVEATGLKAVVRGDPGSGPGWLVTEQEPTALDGQVDEGSEVVLTAQSVLEGAAEDCAIPGGADDGGASLILDFAGADTDSGELIDRHFECVMRQLDGPQSVQAAIMSTRALDGRQTATWDGIAASWTYHPDTGLDLILELED